MGKAAASAASRLAHALAGAVPGALAWAQATSRVALPNRAASRKRRGVDGMGGFCGHRISQP
jgi:hypothetical protein